LAFSGFRALLRARRPRPSWRTPIAGAAALIVALVAIARLYLGAQWLSDVLGGLAFGSAWCALLAIAYVSHRPPLAPLRILAVIPFAVWTAVIGVEAVQARPFDVGRYVAPPLVRTIPLPDWWSDDWRELPARRIDLAGVNGERLVLQWAGPLRVLRRSLAARNWRAPEPWSIATILQRFDSRADAMSLPVLPSLHDGRPPALILIHSGPEDHTRWVLRLWPTAIRLSSDGNAPSQPLWVGSISLQRFRASLAPFGISFSAVTATTPFDLLRAALPDGRVERRSGPPPDKVYLAYDPALPLVHPH
jgi:undecaprenyl-diphosphatase